MNVTSNPRFFSMGVIFSLIGVLIVGQIVSIQNRPDMTDLRISNEEYIKKAGLVVTVPRRGDILDTKGQQLAGSKEVYEVGIDFHSLSEIEANAKVETEAVADAVSKVTGEDFGKLLEKTRADRSRFVYMRLVDGVDPAKAIQLKAMKKDRAENGSNELRALALTAHLMRVYPEGSLGANVLGYVTSLDPQSPIGINGIEARYNSYLAGTTKTLSKPIPPTKITSLPDSPEGATLILTIDRDLQAAVEKIIDQATKDTLSKSGTAIVMDPRTGEILAMASTPRINPNEYWKTQSELLDQKIPWNRAVSQLFEPGSVFKPITMALAIEAGAITRNTRYTDTGSFQAPGWTIHNWDGLSYGNQDMVGCLEHSINTCLSWVSYQLTESKFYPGIASFGIGQLSNIDLQGEDYMPVRQPGDENWTKLSLANNSFGQGIAVAPIQIITALSGIANGGKIMVPHVLKAVVDNGRQYNTPPQVWYQPVSEKTANEVSDMLATAIQGESKVLKIDGYRVAGKTGTAEIPMPNGAGYIPNATNASFVGWGPVDDPHFIVYVWLEQSGSSQPYGSVIAAPVFKDIFMSAVHLTNLPPDAIRKQLTGKSK
jgi:cell division protein FtsI/penicillin-binding protein 2